MKLNPFWKASNSTSHSMLNIGNYVSPFNVQVGHLI